MNDREGVPADQVHAEESELPADLFEITGEDNLHLGGTTAKEGWRVFNAVPGDAVDFVGDIRDLSGFDAGSISAVYASHVLEHVPYQRELLATLRGIFRILKPGGKLFVSVPDLETLCRLYLSPTNDAAGRLLVMRMMFGGQRDPYDFHYVGLNDEFLADLLFRAGFANVYRVPTLGLFDDTSNQTFAGTPISLNMVAVK